MLRLAIHYVELLPIPGCQHVGRAVAYLGFAARSMTIVPDAPVTAAVGIHVRLGKKSAPAFGAVAPAADNSNPSPRVRLFEKRDSLMIVHSALAADIPAHSK